CPPVRFLLRRADGIGSLKLLQDVRHVVPGGQAQAGDVEFLGHGAWLWSKCSLKDRRKVQLKTQQSEKFQ
ncbi:hypothetical protein RZS08_27965, partial [Arthrospira platensis SPKY1]|nr:hypothetical protein [Arthrospira platensis SPKY1]